MNVRLRQLKDFPFNVNTFVGCEQFAEEALVTLQGSLQSLLWEPNGNRLKTCGVNTNPMNYSSVYRSRKDILTCHQLQVLGY